MLIGFYWRDVPVRYIKFFFCVSYKGVVQCSILALFEVLGFKKNKGDRS